MDETTETKTDSGMETSASTATIEEKSSKQSEQNAEMVPKARLDEALNKIKDVEERAELAMSQLRLQHANTPAVTQPTGPQKNIVDTIIERHFEEEDTVAGKDQVKACLKDLAGYFGQVVSSIQVMQSSPNYQEVVNKYFPDVVKSDPSMARAFQALQTQSPALASQFAYKLCVTSPQYLKDQDQKNKPTVKPPESQAANANAEAVKAAADAAIKAAQQPGSASSVGGSGTMDLIAQVNELSKDPEKFDQWTDDVISGRIKF